jgi:hypothetical protein
VFDWSAAARTPTPREIRLVRVSRAKPCAICGRPDWCTRSTDHAMHRCMRVESAVPSDADEGGWLHFSAPMALHLVERAVERTYRSDCGEIMRRWRGATDPVQLDAHAALLGVAPASLQALGVAWSQAADAWAWPMRDPSGETIGIRMREDRDEGARKWAVKASRAGLFLPDPWPSDGPLHICEGPTDAAVLHGWGLPAVGRHACLGQHGLVRRLIVERMVRDAVIVADNDPQGEGRRGAEVLADAIGGSLRTLRIVAPPAGHKDVRRWARAGGNGASFAAMVKAAVYWRRKLA